MKWVKEHRFLTGIICTALVLCLIIVLSFLGNGNTTVIGRQIERAVAIIQKPFASAAQGIRGEIFRFKEILDENDRLKEENAKLRNDIIKARLSEKDLSELRELAEAFGYGSAPYDYSVTVANIISLDGTNWFNIFTIDKGADDGINKKAVVINGEGLIGTVIDVGSDWAKVISIIDETNKVGFLVSRDLNIVGILQGDGSGGLTGFMLDNQANIMEGDTLITSGIGIDPVFPKGIEIGKVTSINNNIDTQLKTITIEPFVKFKNLRKVAVII